MAGGQEMSIPALQALTYGHDTIVCDMFATGRSRVVTAKSHCRNKTTQGGYLIARLAARYPSRAKSHLIRTRVLISESLS